MKKRIITLVLTVALLLTLMPVWPVTASAASELTPSEECVAMLKKWEGFSKKPYWDYSQWTVGYGTAVPSGKLTQYQTYGISEEEAEELLWEHLDSKGRSINSFIDKFGLTITQSQFDALMCLTYNIGTGWLYKTSDLRTAIIEGWTGNELLFALGKRSTAGGSTLPGLVRRRLAEANMYLNGVYDTAVPENYCYVRYDANGGQTDVLTQCFDSSLDPAEIAATATYEGYNFMGWYTDPSGGEQVTQLDAGVRNYTLYAHWSAGDGEGLPQDTPQQTITGTAVSYEKQIATNVLNSFEQPVKGALVVNAHQLGDVVKIVAEYTDTANIKWGKVENGGWINLSYTQKPTLDTEEVPGGSVKVTVTANDVNIRRGPGTGYARVGSVDKGYQMTITATANGSGYVWGKFSDGWIALKYTDYDTVVNGGNTEDNTDTEKDDAASGNTDTTDKVIATGKVTLNSGRLNIRSGPGTGNPAVGSLANGTAVKILEKKTVGTTQWGRIAEGWISLDYVKLDGQTEQEEDKGSTDKPADSNTSTGNTDKPADGNTSTGNTDKPADSNTSTGNTGSTTAVTGKVVVTSGRLNIRSGPGTNYASVGSLAAGTTVTITERKTAGGREWGKMDKGWVCMDYISLNTQTGNGSSQTGNSSAQTVKGTVTTEGNKLRVRTAPSTSAAIAGYLSNGERVEILEKKTVNGTVWGRISKGWISLDYVKLDGSTSSGATDAQPSTPGTSQTVTGTVTLTSGRLNVRSGAGTNNKIVGYLNNGAKVTILETKMVGNVKWGRIEQGWICMDYVK